jgi:D-lactate dehydrogenase (cytochrome)
VSGGVISALDERFQTYLHDESGLVGEAGSISFPESEAEIVAVVAEMRRAGTPITVQGGRTGLAGAAVPLRGHVLNLGRMNGIRRPRRRDDGTWTVTVGPGATLRELERALAGARVGSSLFWPPDPTESTATVGGVVSCAARGLTAMLYGNTREHVAALRVVSCDNAGDELTRDGGARWSDCGLPAFDLLAGGEGMFGVISELALTLRVKPRAVWGICFFFPDRQSVGAVADRLTELESGAVSLSAPECATGPAGASIAAMEYLDRRSLTLVEERRAEVTTLRRLPAIPPSAVAMVYVELHGEEEDAVLALAERLMQIVAEGGGDPDAWAFFTEAEIERLRAVRHAVPEAANLLVAQARQADPAIVTLGTDMSLPGLSFAAALDFYEADLWRAGLDACVFGPLVGNRLYVNILPRTLDEFVRGRRLVAGWAARAVALGGQAVGEHGVGKLKKSLLAARSGGSRWGELGRCKAALDPEGFWNPGNMV